MAFGTRPAFVLKALAGLEAFESGDDAGLEIEVERGGLRLAKLLDQALG